MPFRFKMADADRTSHYLVFVSKKFLGYEIMRGVMANASSTKVDGVASFEYDPRPPLLLIDGRSVEALRLREGRDVRIQPEPATQHPPPDRDVRQHVIDETRGGLGHAPAPAARAEAAPRCKSTISHHAAPERARARIAYHMRREGV